jgi:hypothetical protein
MSRGDDPKVTLQEFGTANLETLLHNLGCILIDAVAVGVGENVVDYTALVGWGTMLAQMLDTPIAKLTMGDKIDACDDFFDSRTLEKERRQQCAETMSKC